MPNMLSKSEKVSSNNVRKKIDEVKQEQADSSNVIASLEDTKKLSLNTNNSDLTDSNEAEAKEINASNINSKESNEVQYNENGSLVEHDESCKKKMQEFDKDKAVTVSLNNRNTENEKLLRQTNRIISFKDDKKIESKEKCEENVGDLKEEKNSTCDNVVIAEIKENEVTPEAVDDEDNIQDEELDHEVDEEEIKGNNDNFNQTDETVGLMLNCKNIYVYKLY